MISQAAHEDPERDPGSPPIPALERGAEVTSSHFPHPTHASHAHPMHCLCLCLTLHLPTPPEICVLGNQIQAGQRKGLNQTHWAEAASRGRAEDHSMGRKDS